jgi:hypothetical protein
MGFDRLQAVGLDASQVEVLRSQFLPEVQRDMGSRVALGDGETEAHRLQRMEDAWMREQGPFSDFAMNVRPLLLARHNPQVAAMVAQMTDRQRAIAGLRGINGAPREGDEEDDEDGPDAWRSPGGSGGAPSSGAARGNLSSLICGMAMGAMFGFLMLLWVGQPSLSRQFRLGIVLGVAINVGWSVAVPIMQKEGDKIRHQIGGDGSSAAGTDGSDGTASSGESIPRLPLGPPEGGDVFTVIGGTR